MLSKLRLPIRTPVLIISVLTLVLIGTLGSVSASSTPTQQVAQGYIAGIMYLGIDVGGTKTLVATLDDNGVLLESQKFPKELTGLYVLVT